MADFGVIGTWAGDGNQLIEASRASTKEALQVVSQPGVPQLSAALEQPIPIVFPRDRDRVDGRQRGTGRLHAAAMSQLDSSFRCAFATDPVGFLALAFAHRLVDAAAR